MAERKLDIHTQSVLEEVRRETDNAWPLSKEETQRVLENYRAGDAPEELFSPEDVQNCKDFLWLMAANDYPGIVEVYEELEETVSHNGHLSRFLGTSALAAEPRSTIKPEFLFEGYRIGATVSASSEPVLVEDLKRAEEILFNRATPRDLFEDTLKGIYPCYPYNGHHGVCFLCKDSRICNQRGGRFTSDSQMRPSGNRLILGELFRVSNDIYPSLLPAQYYIAEMPLGEVLGRHVIDNGLAPEPEQATS